MRMVENTHKETIYLHVRLSFIRYSVIIIIEKWLLLLLLYY